MLRSGIHQVLSRGGDRARAAYRATRASLSPLDTLLRYRLARHVRAPEGLRVDPAIGFLEPHSPQLDFVDEVVRATLDRVATVDPPAEPSRIHMWDGYLDDAVIDRESPFLRFALQPDLIDAVTSYLGVVPILRSIEIWNAWWTPERWNTQRWHCDWDDVTQLKVYVYATDVSIEAGPTTVVGARRSASARRGLRYSFRDGHQGHMLDDEELARVVELGQATPLTGKRGDVAIVDTCRCFHMGGRMASESDARVLAIFQYLRPGALTIELARNRLQFYDVGARSRSFDQRARMVLGVK
jgi:hypothetical protein